MKAYRMVILDDEIDEIVETSGDKPEHIEATLTLLQKTFEDWNQVEGTRLVEMEGDWLLLLPRGAGGGIGAIIQIGDEYGGYE